MTFIAIWTFVALVLLCWKVERLARRVEQLEAQQRQRNQHVASSPLGWDFDKAIADARHHETRVG